MDNLKKLIDFLITALGAAGIPKKITSDIHLAVDEACTNIILYSYPDEPPGNIEMTCAICEKTITITIRDWGFPFNPVKIDDPDLSLDIGDRPIGGLGIYLMKKFSDRIEYLREKNSNLLTIIKKI